MPKATAPKLRTRYVCSKCGSVQMRWAGKCPDCGEWNALNEEVVEERTGSASPSSRLGPGIGGQPQKLSDIRADALPRLPMSIGEFSRVLGGGIVPGSLVLIGGDPGIGKCLSGNTRVFDPKTGDFTPISKFVAKTAPNALAIDEDTFKLTPRSVLAVHTNGVKPVVEIRTKLGRTLCCTANHPLLTPEGWRTADQLRIGSRIASPKALPYFGTEVMTESQIKLIAYILSDGSAQSAISVTNMLPQVEQDLRQIADDFDVKLVCYTKANNRAKQFRFTRDFETRATSRQIFAARLKELQAKSGLSWAELSRRANVDYSLLNMWRRAACVPDIDALNSLAAVLGIVPANMHPDLRASAAMQSSVADFIEKLGLRFSKAHNKFIPPSIFRLPREQLALFLKTLFTCDGSVFVNAQGEPGVSYSTISAQLAEEVQHLLLRFGLVAKRRTKRHTVHDAPYYSYEITLHGVVDTRRFLDSIGIMGREAALEQIAAMTQPQTPSTQKDTIPTGPRFWETLHQVTPNTSFAEMRRKTGVTVRNRRHDRPLSRYVVSALAHTFPHPLLDKLAFGDIYWDEVESIRPLGNELVYDLSIADHHNFVANDLIVHNSTLLLQAAVETAKHIGTTLYISGEESAHQIKMRAERLGVGDAELYLLTETNLNDILHNINTMKPKLAIIDSIQTMYLDELTSSPGTVTQVRECAMRLQAVAKSSGVAIFIVGHVTKEGTIAGPKVLEHIVDTVLQLEGDRFHSFRMLRSIKNRFGATSEVGVFEMVGSGMQEVTNPSEAFLAERMPNSPGSTVAVTMEGTRPLLVEVQALTSPTQNPMPRRTANGFDYNRLFLLLAVLGKRVGVRLHDNDVFVNIVGGMTIDEPAADLAAAVAITSASKGTVIPPDMVVIGEVGLSGEVRSVGQLNARLNEASKLGFQRCILPKTARPIEHPPAGLKLMTARSLGEALDLALER